MNKNTKRTLKIAEKFIKIIALFSVVIVFLILIYSVITSGFYYTFDIDELTHSETVYLIANGYKPFASFFSIYSPIFHYLLLPVFNLSGFNFQGIVNARLFMIVLFIIRIFFTTFLIKKIWGKTASYLFLPLFLLDPFTVFSGMQIRPDNLMLTIFPGALLLFILALKKSSRILLFLSGVGIALTLLISIKIAPSILVFLSLYFFYCLKKHEYKNLIQFFLGFTFLFLLFFLFLLSQGSLFQGIQQMFIDSGANSNSLAFPVPYGFFYLPNNGFIYGLNGKPLSVVYVWILPIIAFMGGYRSITIKSISHSESKEDLLKKILFLSLSAQLIMLFLYHSVSVQYYLPTSFYYAIFAPVFLQDLFSLFNNFKILKNGVILLVFIFLIALTKTSIDANFSRSQNSFTYNNERLNSVWTNIPPDSSSFPNTLFRPLSYPIIYGYNPLDLPSYVLDRYPPIEKVLEKNKIPYLALGDPPLPPYLKPEAQVYILSHYKKAENIPELWTRNAK